MRDWTRRDVLKTGLGAAAGVAVGANTLAGLDVGSVARALTDAGITLPAPAGSPREKLLLDFGWKFALGHASDPAKDFGFGQGNEFAKTGQFMKVSQKEFDDSAWRTLDLPHDWAVELPFVNAPELRDAGYHPLGRDFPATTIGWYRRTIDIPASDLGRRLFLVFDGVMRDAVVALNGWYLVRNLSGYAPIRIDITDMAEYGQKNYLAVRVDAEQRAGWFYEGAGIYRHVWLEKTGPVHVADGGTLVAQEVTGNVAALDVMTEVDNDGEATTTVRLAQSVLDPAGRTVATGRSEPVVVPAGTRSTVHQRLRVAGPKLWAIETPNLYRLTTTVERVAPVAAAPEGRVGAVLDVYDTTFGIRTIHFDPDHGFFLNGKHVELKGTCNHQDHAGVGAALPDRLQYYRVERLKAMAGNAYRTSHNPPTPELLDACDRLGMLVLDETRMFGSAPDALSEIERMIRRDRNHPAIFAWSIANEEFSVQGTARGRRAAVTVKRVVHRLDPTRPVTAAMDHWWEPEGYGDVLDVMGYNYLRGHEDSWHAEHPRQPVMGTEVGSTVSTRGIYVTDKEKGYLSAYDVNAPPWASTAEKWLTFWRARPWLAGGFVWTGFDYRGEPTPYDWPCINSHFGILDTCGFAKDNFYYYQAAWGSEPALHLLPHWNWSGREGQPIDVWAYSNLPTVELLLNGKSLGVRNVPKDGHAEWQVPYAPGVLEARAFASQATSGTPALVVRRETTGPAARIALRPDRTRIAADGQDAAVIEVSIVDAAGRVVPTASDLVTFNVGGAGKLIGVGNGDPSSHESDKGTTRSAFNGLCCAIVLAGRQAGALRVEATAPGLAPATVEITCEPAPARPVA